MRQFLILILVGFSLSGCNFVHKMDIEQGNVYSPSMVSRLHTGMTKAQVQNIMGAPVLLKTFDENRVDYVYTFKTGNQPMTEKRVTLTFDKNGILQNIQ
jgi:outer membrane protein assembly factor BamE